MTTSDKYIIICDIDGTLADIEHRRHHVMANQKDWKAFNEAMHLDMPCKPLAVLIKKLHFQKNNIVLIVSGRSDDYREQTISWLAMHDIPYLTLYMRKSGDYRSDVIVKKEILELIRNDYGNPDIVFDDRQSVVDMWRSEGILCCQVAPEYFKDVC